MGKRTAHNKLTQEQAINNLKLIHGDTYGYDRAIYVDSLTPMDIYCFKHREYFLQSYKSHKKCGCPKCGRERQIKSAKKSKEQFIEDAIKKYGDRDDYSRVEYINNKIEVILICKVHGEYKIRPDLYLKGGFCNKCNRRKTKSNDKELFIKEAIKVYGDKDDYKNTEIISSKDRISITCTKHNFIFEKDIQTYLGGWGCPKCSMENYSKLRMKTLEQFVEEAMEVYGHDHDYTSTMYKGSKVELEIKCKKHDHIFKTLPNNYLNGYGCNKCRYENTRYRGAHHNTKSEYIRLADGRITYLYLIKCTSENESFYKIGKTFRGIEKRFTKTNMPYNYEEVHTYSGDAEIIWDLEEDLHKKYKKYKHKVEKLFDGYSECYNMSLPIEEIINLKESIVCQKE